MTLLPSMTRAGVQPAVPRSDPRRVYPFSIIRGGAYSREELVKALESDPIAESHYSKFQRSQLRTVRSPFVKPVYVSYRKDNAIYWTSHPVALHEGETLLTDGKFYARARCGNRISLVPMLPAAQAEPLSETLDLPEIPLPDIPESLLAAALEMDAQPTPMPAKIPEDFANPSSKPGAEPHEIPETLTFDSALVGVLPEVIISPIKTPAATQKVPVEYPVFTYPIPISFVPPPVLTYTPPAVLTPPDEVTTPEPAQFALAGMVIALLFVSRRRAK